MTTFEPGGEEDERRKEYEARAARLEQSAAVSWAVGPDPAHMGPGATIPIPLAQLVKVRFIHSAGDFEESGADAHFDAEMSAVPRFGDHIAFPQWFYRYGCSVTEVHWMLGDDSPADVCVLVES